ncbi:hypothetical protein LAG90_06480 [Marinilongibacter aquaticus]|uniref:hypothetical protein n=1 Tax=Marinilongibacter aquaticus TaxID=2975157 RepID=UPI0021BDE7EE|nr:hypothetical protein [Marinilongibacter aquaticus]UBM60288.1 hypothetical protein LAG90_06480 [Marinilongibacter aquaticus]
MKSLLYSLLLLLSPWALSAQNIQQYVGKYAVENAPFSTVKIFQNEDKLIGEAVGQGRSELSKLEDEHAFGLTDYPGASMVFSTNKKGHVNGFVLHIDGESISGTKVFPKNDEYLGKFQITDGPVSGVEIKDQDGQLRVWTAEYGEADLQSEGIVDQFRETGYGSLFTFLRNDKNEVSNIKIDLPSQGVFMEGKKMAAAGLEKYVGTFGLLDMDMKIVIDLVDGQLQGTSPQGDFMLEAGEGQDVFIIPSVDAKFTYKFKDNGEVDELQIIYNGSEVVAYPEK